jgi:hypothetical protein
MATTVSEERTRQSDESREEIATSDVPRPSHTSLNEGNDIEDVASSQHLLSRFEFDVQHM